MNNFINFLGMIDALCDDHALIESIANAYVETHPLVEMKDPIDWSAGMKPGQRVGKSERNIAAAKEKNANPVTVRFHRTKSEYADAIAANGLKRKNGNYGQNTADHSHYEPVIWTANNPDDIPVLRHVADNPRYSDKIQTFRVTMPKDYYENTKRYAFPRGRCGGMVPVTGKQNSLSNEGSYKIDVFREDIPPQYLKLMPKTVTSNGVLEVDKFRSWIKTNPGEWAILQKKLPAELVNSLTANAHPSYKRSIANDANIMDRISEYIPDINSRQPMSWTKYNSAIAAGQSPHDAAAIAMPTGHTNRPWLGKDAQHNFAFNRGSISNGDELANAMKMHGANAVSKNYDAIKDSIIGNADSVIGKYDRLFKSFANYNGMADLLEDFYSREHEELLKIDPLLDVDAATTKAISERLWKDYASLTEPMISNAANEVFSRYPNISPSVKQFLLKRWHSSALIK